MTIKQTPAQAAGVADRQWTMEDVVAMSDRYHESKLAAEFEAAFEAKFTPKRQLPKSYTPTPKSEIPLPWYLDVNGAEPEENDEKP